MRYKLAGAGTLAVTALAGLAVVARRIGAELRDPEAVIGLMVVGSSLMIAALAYRAAFRKISRRMS